MTVWNRVEENGQLGYPIKDILLSGLLKSFLVRDWILQCILQCHELATIASGSNLAVAHTLGIILFFRRSFGFLRNYPVICFNICVFLHFSPLWVFVELPNLQMVQRGGYICNNLTLFFSHEYRAVSQIPSLSRSVLINTDKYDNEESTKGSNSVIR